MSISKPARPHSRRFVLPAFSIAILALFAVAYQGSVWASGDLTLLARLRAIFAATPVQGGIGSRTIISTIAGGGFASNAPAMNAPMAEPSGVALDPLGRGFYVVDDLNGSSLLRFVNTTGNPVTIAGTTIAPGAINLIAGGGVSTESETARDAELTIVTGMVVDPSGNAVYLAAPLAGGIRAINVSAQEFRVFNQTIAPGAIKTVFLINRPEIRALAMNPAREFFYISSSQTSGARVVYKLDSNANGGAGIETVYAGGGAPANGNGDGQVATLARLTQPMAVAIDAQGNLLIADGGDNRNNPGSVRKVDSGGIISSLVAGLEFPTGITMTPQGNALVALGNAQQIVRVTPGGAKTVVAGNSQKVACDQLSFPVCGDGGAATVAFLNLPGSTQQRTITFAADSNGIYLPDFDYRRVRFVNTTGGAVTIAGTSVGPAQIKTVAGSGQQAPYDNVPATISELAAPTGVAADAAGNLFIADTRADPLSRIRFVNRGSTPVTLFASTPWAMTAQPGHIITLNHSAGELVSDDRITTAVFASPQGLAVAPNGLYIVDSQYGALIRPRGSLNGRRSGHIRFLNTSGADVTIFPQGGSARVVVPPGQIKDIVGRNDAPPAGVIGENGPANGAVIFPADVALDAAGNLYIADQGNNRIRKVNASTGIITSVQAPQPDQTIGPLATNGAAGIAFGPDGRLHIADTRADRVLRQDAPGGTAFSIIANNAKGISRPRDLAVDPSGHVFVVNSNTHQILRIVAPGNALGATNVVAGTGTRGFAGDGGPGNRARLDLPTPGTAPNDVQVTTNIIRLVNGDLVFTDTDNNRVRLLVQLPNQAPVLAAVANRAIDEGASATIDLSATDGNQDSLAFSASNLPGFASLTDNGNGTARLQLNPGFTDAGSYVITVSVSDGDAGDSKSFTVTVNDVNRAPAVTATLIASPREATAANGRLVDLSGSATDPDGDTISYKWFDGPTQIAASASAQVTLAIGNHSIFLMAADSKGANASSAAQSIVVRDSTPPVIAGVPAGITAQATGDNGANVNYTMPAATDAVDGNVAVSADKPSGSLFPVGATTVKFTATDSRGNAAMASFTVTVTPQSGGGGGGGGNGGGGTPASYTISTFAGNGNYGNEGNHGPATSATFKQITAVGRGAGGVITVDSQSRVARQIDAQGVIRPLIGNGANGNTGDNNLAIYATFGSPGGVAVDAQGNLYISDTAFHRVRRVGADGRITHFAGSSTAQSGAQGDNGVAAAAKLNRPTALAVDRDNLYVIDSGNQRVRAIDLATNIITTYAGNGGAGYGGDNQPAFTTSLNNPSGLAFDAAGNLYIADRGNNRVRRVDAATKLMTTIAGDGVAGYAGDNGPAVAAQLNNPSDVAVDAAGNVYITDLNNHRVRRIVSGAIATIAGGGSTGFDGDGGPAAQAQLNFPTSIEIDADGSVYVGDYGNLRVRKLSPVAGPAPTPTPTPTPAPNRNPVISSAIGNQSIARGQTLDLPLAATDPDNDNVSFTLVNAPSFASIVNGNPPQRTATLRLQPTQAGSFTGVRIKADDGRGGSATSAAFNITVFEPSNNSCLAVVPAGRWRGEYFNNRFLTGSPVMARDDGQGSLNFDWGYGGPSAECNLGIDEFSARWTREVQLLGGRYRFTTFSDDGLRLYIDGELRLDRWFDHGEIREDIDVDLAAGAHTFQMDYYERGGLAAARLFWNALNLSPTVPNIANQSVRHGQTVDVEIIAADADNDSVKLTLENAPPFITLVNADQALRKATLRIAPPAGGGDERFDLRVKADDLRGGIGFSNTFSVSVATGGPPPQNRPPVAVANALPATVTAPDTTGAVIRLDASASSDPDGDALSYSWTDQGTVISTAKVADVKLPIGAHLIALSVNDGKGGVSAAPAQSFTINAPPAPAEELAINTVSPSFGKRGATINLVITGSGFAPGATAGINGGAITVVTTYVSGTQLNARLTISNVAVITARGVSVTNPGGASVTKSAAFSVTP